MLGTAYVGAGNSVVPTMVRGVPTMVRGVANYGKGWLCS